MRLEAANAKIVKGDASLAATIVKIESEEAYIAKINARIGGATGDSVAPSYLPTWRDDAIDRMGYWVHEMEYHRREASLLRNDLNWLKQEAGLLASVTG